MQNTNNAGTPAITNEGVKPKKAATKVANKIKEKKPLVFRNVFGDDMDPSDYVYAFQEDDEKSGYKAGDVVLPPYFNKVCGMPVEREDLLEVFNKTFKPEDNFLFYKTSDKEVYIVVIPLKFATQIGVEHNSQAGDFQKHSISFIVEGSANVDTLKAKLKRVANSIHYGDK